MPTIQIVQASQRQVPVGAMVAEVGSDDPLLSFAGPIVGSHALIIAPNGVDVLCRLLRRGCVAATSLRLAERPEHAAFDLVFAPSVADGAGLGRLIEQAKRALVPTGRFVACLPGPAAGQDIAGILARSLRLAGFVAINTKAIPGGVLVRADLPLHPAQHSAPRLLGRLG